MYGDGIGLVADFFGFITHLLALFCCAHSTFFFCCCCRFQISTPSIALSRLPVQPISNAASQALRLEALERILYSKEGCRNSGRRALRIRQEIIARKVFEVEASEERPIVERPFFKKLVSVIVEDHSTYQVLTVGVWLESMCCAYHGRCDRCFYIYITPSLFFPSLLLQGFELAIALCKQAFIRCAQRKEEREGEVPASTSFGNDEDNATILSVGGDTGEQPRKGLILDACHGHN